MLVRLASLAAILSLAACGGSQTASSASATPAENPCGENPCGGTPAAAPGFDLPVDISTWPSWTKANAETFLSKSHQKVMVDVYVSNDHAEAYKALAGAMPVGTALVKAQHENAGGQKGAGKSLTVMVKMEAGFDPEHGDWYYGVYSYDGKKAMMEGKSDGKTAMCVNCHDTADVDYVFGSK